MKKLLSLLGLILALTACGSNRGDFKGNSYQLQDAKNGAVVILTFDKSEPKFYGVVVNRYFGTYQTDGNKITFDPAGSTMMMGPESEMEAEQEFLQTLPLVSEYQLNGDELTLITQNGGTLKFSKIIDSE